MLDKPISPLRQRMIEDMTARRFKEKVQKDYVRHVRSFAVFLGRSPDAASSEDVRRFQLHMATQQIGARSKLLQLMRLIPFVERNYNLIELGPVETATWRRDSGG